MYVWRGKNRRDKRNFVTSGSALWGPADGSKDTSKEDEKHRQAHEKEFVDTFTRHVKNLIYNYLNTNHGKEEIGCVSDEVEKKNKKLQEEEEKRKASEGKSSSGSSSSAISLALAPASIMKQKDNIRAIFQKFDTDGSNAIDRNELRVLLAVLRVPISEDRIDQLLRSMDSDGNAEIDFDEFYKWFLAEMNDSGDMWTKLTSGRLFFGPGSLALMSGGSAFTALLHEVEARNLIQEVTVQRTEQDARKEFRIVHPPLLPCPRCDFCALSQAEMFQHNRDASLHQDVFRKRSEFVEKEEVFDAAFLGAQGRRLIAHRLLFAVDLGGMESRLKVAALEPYRPRIADPGGLREDQLRRGLLVQGEDPMGGVRAIPRQKLLFRQHRAPGALAANAQFQDALVALKHHESAGVDTVNAAAGSMHTDVTLTWKTKCFYGVDIVGEMNGWKADHMIGDPYTKLYSLTYALPPGRYRYKYIVDGETMLDNTASQITDPDGQTYNIVAVSNPTVFASPTKDIPQPEKLQLSNAMLGDDGAWALASALKPNTVVRELDLSHNSISDEGIQGLAGHLPHLHALETLKLNCNGFGVDGCRYVASALRESTSILSLELARNKLGDDAAEQLGRMLTHHRSIRKLYLDGNYIGNDGADHIAQGLEKNRTLLVLSMSANRLQALGAGSLSVYLKRNASLTELRLDSNPLGPDGCQHIGAMLASNESIRVLNLDNTLLMLGTVHHGLYTITYALRKNFALRHLSLRNNMITAEAAPEIAAALNKNKYLLTMDLAGNTIPGDWFLPNHYLQGMGETLIPSIRTSLDFHNAEADFLSSRHLTARQRFKNVEGEIADTFEGYWTVRHAWKALVTKALIAQAAEEAMRREMERVEDESAYVLQEVQTERDNAARFLRSFEGRKLISSLAHSIIEFVKKLSRPRPQPQHEAELMASQQLAIVANLMLTHGADDKYYIPVDNVLGLMHALALPCIAEDLVDLRKDINAVNYGKVGIRTLLRFIKNNHVSLCKSRPLERLRLVSERHLSSGPYEDARRLYLGNIINAKFSEETKKYRDFPFKDAQFPCKLCLRRFPTAKDLAKHKEKTKEHKLYRLKRKIWGAERRLILFAKWHMTGTLFPAYYELNPDIKYHKEVSPQVFDSRGQEGRPVGIIEPELSVRVEDLVGHWMQVRHEDRLGWTKWREGSFNVMIPAKGRVKGFWEGANTYRRPVLFRVSDDLPASVELKVRQMPCTDGVVCGNLTSGMVLQCWGELGPWLQLRYHHVACAWALREVGGRTLLARIDDSIQKKLAQTIALSPCVIPLSRLDDLEFGPELTQAGDDEKDSDDELL